MKSIRIMLLGLLLVMVPAVVSAEGWSKLYGGGEGGSVNSIHQIIDGGYIAAGSKCSVNTCGIWIVKLANNGDVIWQRIYGGNSSHATEIAYSIEQTFDGGYIVAGKASSFGMGSDDAWILKLDSNGNVQWQKSYGGDKGEGAKSIEQTAGGGYIVSGTTASFEAEHGNVWLLKLDKVGNIVWQKRYGSSVKSNTGRIIRVTSDGGYIVAGDTATGLQLASSSAQSTASDKDSWPDGVMVIKLDGNGDIQWQKVYSSIGLTNDLRQTSDGGYILAGYTFSYGAGRRDAWILKLSTEGDIQWQKSYGGSGSDEANSILQTSDGGFIVAGQIDYSSSNYGGWLLRTDKDGNIQWQRSYEFPAERAYAVNLVSDGGYIVSGYPGWVAKVDDEGNINDCSIVNTPNAVALDSTAGSYDAGLTVQNSTAVALDTNAVVDDFDKLPTGVCISGSMMPPFSRNTYIYSPVLYPSLDPDPAFAEPIGVGPIAYEVTNLLSQYASLHINLLPFTSPVDIYGAFTHPSNPAILRVLNPDQSFQSVSFEEIAQSLKDGALPAGIVPWKENTMGPINEDLFGKKYLSSGIASGTYTVYLLVTPAGGLDSYYLWKTYFIIP